MAEVVSSRRPGRVRDHPATIDFEQVVWHVHTVVDIHQAPGVSLEMN
jgi:hypothetical protein